MKLFVVVFTMSDGQTIERPLIAESKFTAAVEVQQTFKNVDFEHGNRYYTYHAVVCYEVQERLL